MPVVGRSVKEEIFEQRIAQLVQLFVQSLVQFLHHRQVDFPPEFPRHLQVRLENEIKRLAVENRKEVLYEKPVRKLSDEEFLQELIARLST